MKVLPSTSTVDEIVAALAEAGGCIVKSFVSLDIIKSLENDFTPHLEAEVEPWTGNHHYFKYFQAD